MNAKLTRIKLGLTQRDITQQTGLSSATIVKIEKGDIDNIKFGTLKSIAAALNSTIEELFLAE